jgi:hypothetical protein
MSGLYIKRFIDRLQSFESRGVKDFSCPMQDAKNLHADITKLLIDLEQAKNQLPSQEQVITVQMEGGSF